MMLTMLRIASHGDAPGDKPSPMAMPAGVTSMCHLATGRSALHHLIDRLEDAKAATVLMPCYVAEGVIKPFSAAGLRIEFYRLNADLSPNVDDVRTLLERTDGSFIFVLVHFFGFPAYVNGLNELLVHHRALLIEDCAHALMSMSEGGRPLAENTGIALYSLNKFLPVTDGAILVSRTAAIDVSLDVEAFPELPGQAQEAYTRHLAACRDLFECADPARARVILSEIGASYEEYYAIINGDLSVRRQSKASRAFAERFSFDACAQRRRENARYVYAHLNSESVKLVHEVLPSGVVPFGLPARVPSGRRAEVLDALFDRGILLSTLQDKWTFVPDDRRDFFQFEASFLNDHVLIPVSEFITLEAMDYMVLELNRV